MGANFCYRVYPDSQGRESILASWNQAVDNSLYESGHSYSGDIGMMGHGVSEWHDLNGTRNQATDWLAKNQEKWECAKAASFQENGQKHWMIGGSCSS